MVKSDRKEKAAAELALVELESKGLETGDANSGPKDTEPSSDAGSAAEAPGVGGSPAPEGGPAPDVEAGKQEEPHPFMKHADTFTFLYN